MSKWKLTSFEILSGAGLLIISGASTSPAQVIPAAAIGAGAVYFARRSERLGRLAAGTPAHRLLVDGDGETESTKLALPPKEQERRKKERQNKGEGGFGFGPLSGFVASISSQTATVENEDVRTSALPEVNPEKAAQAPDKAQKAKPESDADWVAQASAGVPDGLEVGKLASLRQVVDALNKQVDDFPHVLVVGDSGAGKTTLVQLIVGTRPGKVVILDPKRPKGWEGPKWGGLPYVSRDKQTASYDPMVKALAAVVKEMDRRYRTQDEATEPFEQLTVVLDEGKNSVEESPRLAELYRKIVSIGREVGIRLILISTTDRAGKLGFDGEADSMESFAWVQLGEFALKVRAELRERGKGQPKQKVYWAAASFAGGWIPFENEKAFGLLPSLNLRRTKAWSKVEYNCQVEVAQPIRKAQTDVRVAAPATADRDEGVREAEMYLAEQMMLLDEPKTTKQMQALVVADEQERPVVNGYQYTDEDLAVLRLIEKRLAESPKVSRISVDESAEPRNETSALSSALSRQQDATFGVSPLLEKLAQAAALTLKDTSEDERLKLRNTLQFHKETGRKMEAIQRGFDCTSGPKYQRGKELFDAAQTIAEYQTARTKK